jgi:hypothetical protein
MRTDSPLRLTLALALALGWGASGLLKPAAAQDAHARDARKKDRAARAEKADKAANKVAAKPEQLGSYGDWGAYAAQGGRDKTCYALAQPKDRTPKGRLKDVTAYVFISTRPAENIRNEVAINLGYPTKDGSAAVAEIDGASYELITKGDNAWVKDQSKEKEFVGALRGGSKLVVKASSARGTNTTDSYSLRGFSDALVRVVQECK